MEYENCEFEQVTDLATNRFHEPLSPINKYLSTWPIYFLFKIRYFHNGTVLNPVCRQNHSEVHKVTIFIFRLPQRNGFQYNSTQKKSQILLCQVITFVYTFFIWTTFFYSISVSPSLPIPDPNRPTHTI